MGDKIYKKNQPIKVVFQALGGQTGIIDLSMVVYDPSDNASSPVIMTELSNGLYEAVFTPDENGRWWAEITSSAYPENGSKTSYVVGYQEGTNDIIIVDIDGTPTTTDFATDSTSSEIRDTIGQESGSTVLSKLQNIWNKLTSLFTDGLAKVKIWDGVDTALVSSNGELESRFIQNKKVSESNNHTSNINAGVTWEGTGESTLSASGIQINLKVDQACTVTLEQSTDNSNWDISETWLITAGTGDGRTFQAIANYFRVKVTNNGASPTTYLRLQTILCPIVEVLPKSLTPDGRLKVESTSTISASSIPLQVAYDKAFSAVNANEWQEVAEYVVPDGYTYTTTSFRCHSETAGETARVIVEEIAGTFDGSTDTFTDIGDFLLPQFGSGVYIEVTTQIGVPSNDTITITYTNEHGTTGRTCTILLPKSSPVGTHFEGVLEGNDIGISAVTNVTHSATGQAGAFTVEMYYSVFNLLMKESGKMYQAQSIAGDPVVIPAGTSIILQVLAGTKTSYTRFLSLFGGLVPA